MDAVQTKLVFEVAELKSQQAAALAEMKQQVTALQEQVVLLTAKGHTHEPPAPPPPKRQLFQSRAKPEESKSQA